MTVIEIWFMIPNYLICTSFYQEKRAIGNFIF